MATSSNQGVSPVVRFPNFAELGDLNALSVVVQDLSLIYDITAVAVLPGYSHVPMPAVRVGPRRRSPLYGEDRLLIKSVSLSSPLEIVFWVMSGSSALGITAISFNRVASAVKAWLDVLSAGVDLQERRLALELNRALAPEQLQEAQLRNALRERQLRQVSVPQESGVVDRAREELRDPSSAAESSRGHAGSQRRIAGTMSSEEFAELLDEPVDRLFGYAGGELQVAGDEEVST